MYYGEIIIGPPGSGKSTYASYKKELLKDRNVITINLDPGNNIKTFDYDIKSISNTSERMKRCDYGPNYSVKTILNDFLEKFDTQFIDFIQSMTQNEEICHYFLFDFPGQVEFFMVDDVLKNICYKLQKQLNFSLVCVNLVDSVFFTNKHSLVSTYLCSTIAMVLLEMPHVNVISKCDNLKNYANMFDHNFNLEDVLGCFDILKYIEPGFLYNSMEFVSNESLLSYEFLDYQKNETIGFLQMIIDKASGFLYSENVDYGEIESKDALLEFYNDAIQAARGQ